MGSLHLSRFEEGSPTSRLCLGGLASLLSFDMHDLMTSSNYFGSACFFNRGSVIRQLYSSKHIITLPSRQATPIIFQVTTKLFSKRERFLPRRIGERDHRE